MYQLININECDNKWILGVKNILVSCGIPLVDTYVKYISNAEFQKYIKRRCENLAIQFWHTMLHTTSLCDCYKKFKHRLLLEEIEGKSKDTTQPIPLRTIHVTEKKSTNHGPPKPRLPASL